MFCLKSSRPIICMGVPWSVDEWIDFGTSVRCEVKRVDSISRISHVNLGLKRESELPVELRVRPEPFPLLLRECDYETRLSPTPGEVNESHSQSSAADSSRPSKFANVFDANGTASHVLPRT